MGSSLLATVEGVGCVLGSCVRALSLRCQDVCGFMLPQLDFLEIDKV